MAAPTNPIILSHNSNIDDLVGEDTEIIVMTTRQMYPKSVNVEDNLAKVLVREVKLEDAPTYFAMTSINGQRLSPIEPGDPLFDAKTSPDGFNLVDVSWKFLMFKGANLMEAFRNLALGDKGDCNVIMKSFYYTEVVQGACPAPISKITDITVLP